MKRAGRIHWMVAVSIATLIALVGLFVFEGDTPDKTARAFMSALAKGDAQKLADLTYLNTAGKSNESKETRDEMVKKWQATTDAGKYYRFLYTVGEAQVQPDESASVTVQVNRTPMGGGGYDEHFELPMVKEDGHWKVHVQAISRDMYPYMPR